MKNIFLLKTALPIWLFFAADLIHSYAPEKAQSYGLLLLQVAVADYFLRQKSTTGRLKIVAHGVAYSLWGLWVAGFAMKFWI